MLTACMLVAVVGLNEDGHFGTASGVRLEPVVSIHLPEEYRKLRAFDAVSWVGYSPAGTHLCCRAATRKGGEVKRIARGGPGAGAATLSLRKAGGATEAVVVGYGGGMLAAFTTDLELVTAMQAADYSLLHLCPLRNHPLLLGVSIGPERVAGGGKTSLVLAGLPGGDELTATPIPFDPAVYHVAHHPARRQVALATGGHTLTLCDYRYTYK